MVSWWLLLRKVSAVDPGVMSSLSSDLLQRGEARFAAAFRCFMGGMAWRARLRSRFCRNQEEVSIQPENHPARRPAFLASRILPRYVGREGAEGERQERRYNAAGIISLRVLQGEAISSDAAASKTGSVSDL
ncbi:uncharacterized protein LOC105432923 [Pogonomyrmex barbatus]|uniref:Uncharacterized protein LOC105432923 n=1 Tax=Pogonomyrmex barbatus TaxID=144034 RepID=A0A6I9WUM8_9HYME|nr:uncharacterized protein LOC105432923 [Pogonomyrmex barbatus]